VRRIVTLTSDFGTKDGFVGAMKGVILSLAPEASVVDITHEVPPQSVWDAAFALEASCPYFPEGTVHVAEGTYSPPPPPIWSVGFRWTASDLKSRIG